MNNCHKRYSALLIHSLTAVNNFINKFAGKFTLLENCARSASSWRNPNQGRLFGVDVTPSLTLTPKNNIVLAWNPCPRQLEASAQFRDADKQKC